MWEAFGDATVTCMARGTRYLAKVWQAAWTLGDGDTKIKLTPAITKSDLMSAYNDPEVVPSIALNKYPAKEKWRSDWSGLKR